MIGRMSRAKSKGQALPLVAILLAAGVLIGFLAIAIDGGSALLQRRTMQNGADAAVLPAVNLMSDNTFQSCVPAPCHPSYGLTNGNVFAQITALTGNNRGGAVGAGPGNYGVSFAYHFISGAPTSPFTVDPYGYGPIVTDMNDLVPDFADGVAVTNTIKNPTIFVRALPSSVVGTQLTEMAISARAAGRIYATCPPAPQPGRTLPFTRFYPAIQWEIDQAGNDPLNPFPLWQSNQDISNDGSLKNMVSLAQASHWGGQQLITQFDTRDGTTGPFSPNEAGQMLEYGANAPGDPYVDCSILSPCAKMYGSASGNQDSTDISNYVFWRWRGLVSVNSTWPSQPGRLGDWAETYHIGDAGNNIHQPLIDLFTYVPPSAPGAPAPGPLSGPPLNLGPAITMTIFMWG